MAIKHYKAKVLKGRNTIIDVSVSASTLAQAKAKAEHQGRVLSIKQSIFANTGGRMSLNDRLVFFQRLASMLAARVGTTEALDVIYQSFSGSVREAARILKENIETGESLHGAMAIAGPKFFPEAIVAIIKTGSSGGDLAYAIREAARFERELAQVKKESGKGIFSALSGFVLGIGTILASTMYVAPQILGSSFVEASGGADIGWVMTMADVITVIALIAAALVGLLFFFGVVLRPLFPGFVDRVIVKIPFYRDMVLAKANYMVLFGLAVLLKAGLRVEEALTLTIDGAPRGELRNDLERAKECITKGSSTPWPYVMKMLHPTDKAALATAQDREQTARTIEELAFQYQMLYRARMETFVPVMQGFSAIFLSLAGFIMFGVSVIPLMQSSSAIMGGGM